MALQNLGNLGNLGNLALALVTAAVTPTRQQRRMRCRLLKALEVYGNLVTGSLALSKKGYSLE